MSEFDMTEQLLLIALQRKEQLKKELKKDEKGVDKPDAV
jgi:hypothetical protein